METKEVSRGSDGASTTVDRRLNEGEERWQRSPSGSSIGLLHPVKGLSGTAEREYAEWMRNIQSIGDTDCQLFG